MSGMQADLRAAMREVAALSGAAGSDALPGGVPTVAPPRHQPGTERGGFGRSFRRWWRSLTGAETQPTSFPPASRQSSAQAGAPSTAPSSQQQHLSQFETQKSIAILPFRNLSNDAEASFYEFSLADAVITELARNRSLIVRPSSMIVKYQGKEVDPRQVGRDLNVSAVLLASFLRAGATLRVNAQLVEVNSGEMLWSDRIDASAEDIIALQDKIAQRIAQGLNVEQQPSQVPTPTPTKNTCAGATTSPSFSSTRSTRRTATRPLSTSSTPSGSTRRSRSHTADSARASPTRRSEEHTSELQSHS